MQPFFLLAIFIVAGSVLETFATRRPNICTWFSPNILLARCVVLAAIYGFWLAVTNRPFSAMLPAIATVGVFVASSRIKEHLLQEPIVFLDLQFVGQILRYPRLYYAQLLLAPRNAFIAGVAVVAASALLVALLRSEKPFEPGPPPALTLLLFAGPFMLWLLPRDKRVADKIRTFLSGPAAELRPGEATAKWGIFPPLLAQYCRWIVEKDKTTAARLLCAPTTSPAALPHVLAVQCESFIDPARIFHHAPELPSFYAAKIRSAAHGPLDVPCGGAYTMRTEFGFLTGTSQEALGCDRYNPYARADRRDYPSLAKTLRKAGYATDFVHPHDLRFFRRHRVMPALGFDRLHGGAQFDTAPRLGPHVSDTALADYLIALFAESNGPRFVFAVTMENHGPWFPGRLEGCGSAREAYFRHLCNSDRMLGILGERTRLLDRPLILCWYGDHAPILTRDFAHDTTPHTDYLITTTEPSRASAPPASTLPPHELAHVLLSLVGKATEPHRPQCTLRQPGTTNL